MNFLRNISASLVLVVLLSITTSDVFAINKFDGLYRDSIGHKTSVNISGSQMIISFSRYEFYGYPPYKYEHFFRIKIISDSKIEIKHRRSRIIDKPKRLGGLRLFARNTIPNVRGKYEYDIDESGKIYFHSLEGFDDMILLSLNQNPE